MAKQRDLTRNINQIEVEDESEMEDDYKMYPVAPLHLTYVQRRFWDKLIASLPYDWFITADLVMLEMYVITYCDFQEMHKKALDTGLVYEDDKGGLKTNPYWTIAEKLKYTLLVTSGKLKLNPKSRDGDTITAAREEAKEKEVISKVGRRKGLMFIPGGKQ